MGSRQIRRVAAQQGGITHGRQVNATNTGIAKHGLTRAGLTPLAGGTFSTNGATYTERLITTGMLVTGNDITFRRCQIEDSASADGKVIEVEGARVKFEDCTIKPTTGSAYMGIASWMAVDMWVTGCVFSNFENAISINDDVTGFLMEFSYLHSPSGVSNPGDAHKDLIEIYGCTNTTLRKNRFEHGAQETCAINIAPWNTGISTFDVYIEDNFIDGGHEHIIVDLQSESGAIALEGVRVVRNDMGGHTTYTSEFGRYISFRSDFNFCETQAQQNATPTLVLCPTSGPDVNRWAECSDLTPDRTGQVVDPNSAPVWP